MIPIAMFADTAPKNKKFANSAPILNSHNAIAKFKKLKKVTKLAITIEETLFELPVSSVLDKPAMIRDSTSSFVSPISISGLYLSTTRSSFDLMTFCALKVSRSAEKLRERVQKAEITQS